MILDWIIIGLISAMGITLLSSVCCLILLMRKQQKLHQLVGEKPKNKGKKRQRWKKKVMMLKSNRKRDVIWTAVLLTFTIMFGTLGFFAHQYQSTHLGPDDVQAVAKGHFYLQKVEENLQLIHDSENESEEIQAQNTLRELCGKMASYGARTADGRLSTEGRVLLNRMYAQMKSLGLNLNAQSIEMIKDEENYDSYQKDIRQLKKQEKSVYDYFQINESDLKK